MRHRGQVLGQLALEPDVARRPVASRAWCARRTPPGPAAAAGRSRPRRRPRRPRPPSCDPDDPTLADHQVRDVHPGLDGDPPGREPVGQCRRRARPCRPRRSRRRSAARGRRPAPPRRARCAGRGPRPRTGSAATWRSRSSLKRLLEPPMERLARVQARGDVRAAGRHGPRHLEVAAAQHLPVVGVGRRHGRPTGGPGPGRARRTPRSGRPGTRPGSRSAVASSKTCSRITSSGTRSISRSAGPARLAEQVADHRRQQRRGGGGVPGEVAFDDRRERAAERRQPLQQGDLVAELGQPGGGRHAAEPATDDDDAVIGDRRR